MLYENILEAIGHTPLIRLQKIADPKAADIYVKYEGLNVGGSIKTRTAYNMLMAARKTGLLNKDSIIVEATSGNQGIGLALVGAVMGYRVIIVMPDSVSAERRKLIKQYGAEVILVKDEGNIGACIKECQNVVRKLQMDDPNVFVPAQFENSINPMTHYQETAKEIIDALDKPIDAFCAGIGTGGTISGIGKALKEVYPHLKVVAIEPQKAAILSGGEISTHLQMGIGDGLIPKVLDRHIYDEIQTVSDEEAIKTAKDLARYEGILAGISSGSNVAVALRLAQILGKGKIVVTVLPDTGERYISTPLFD